MGLTNRPGRGSVSKRVKGDRENMSEDQTRLVIMEEREEYEKNIGLPRHEANLENFKMLFNKFSRLEGALWAFTLSIGLPGFIASIIVVVRVIRAH